MHTTQHLARRPLIGILAGLALVSACSPAAESAPTPVTSSVDTIADRPVDTAAPTPTDPTVVSTAASTIPPPTTAPPTTAPPTTVPASTTPPATQPPATQPPATTPPATTPPVDPEPIDAVDVPGGTVFGVGVYDAVDADAVIDVVSARLGAPTADDGWQPMGDRPNCAGSTAFRALWWGDFRMTLERYEGNGIVRDELSAWTVGDPTLFVLAPIGEVPTLSPSNIVTPDGIGLGSTRADVEATWPNVHNGGDGRLVVVDQGGLLTISLDANDRVVGFGDGPFDCPTDEVR